MIKSEFGNSQLESTAQAPISLLPAAGAPMIRSAAAAIFEKRYVHVFGAHPRASIFASIFKHFGLQYEMLGPVSSIVLQPVMGCNALLIGHPPSPGLLMKLSEAGYHSAWFLIPHSDETWEDVRISLSAWSGIKKPDWQGKNLVITFGGRGFFLRLLRWFVCHTKRFTSFCKELGLPMPKWRIPFHSQGFCYSISEVPSCPTAKVLMLEDDYPLYGPCRSYEDIVRIGEGRWLIWKKTLHFSSSTNDSPTSNGRTYRVLLPTVRDIRLDQQFYSDPPRIEEFANALSEWISADNSNSTFAPDALKKVAFATMSLASGGAERQWVQLAKESARSGMQTSMVTFLSSYPGSDHYEHLLGSAIPFHKAAEMQQNWDEVTNRINTRALEVLRELPPSLGERVLSAYHLWCKDTPDIVACQQDPANIYGGIAALLAGVPRIILSIRAMWPTQAVTDVYPWIGALYPILARSSRITFCANSREAAQDFAPRLHISPNKIHFLPNAIDPGEWPPPDPRRRKLSREALGFGDKERVVLSIARFVEDKQHKKLLEHMIPLLKGSEKVRLLLVGEGPLRDEIAHSINDLMLSHQARIVPAAKDTEPFYQAADLFVLASRNEGTPNVLMEATYYGLPVVAFDVGGVSSCLSNVEHHLAKLGDWSDFADAVSRLLEKQHARGPSKPPIFPSPADALAKLISFCKQGNCREEQYQS